MPGRRGKEEMMPQLDTAQSHDDHLLVRYAAQHGASHGGRHRHGHGRESHLPDVPSSKCPGMEKVERGERRRACPYRSS